MLRTQGEPPPRVGLSWPSVDRARAYFISGMYMQILGENSYALTVWSSAEVPGAGQELHAYLSGSYIDKWLKQKIRCLPAPPVAPSRRASSPAPPTCRGPAGQHAGHADDDRLRPGKLDHLSARRPTRSSRGIRSGASACAPSPPPPRCLGMDFGNMQQMDDGDGQQQQQQKKPGMKGLLKGILGG